MEEDHNKLPNWLSIPYSRIAGEATTERWTLALDAAEAVIEYLLFQCLAVAFEPTETPRVLGITTRSQLARNLGNKVSFGTKVGALRALAKDDVKVELKDRLGFDPTRRMSSGHAGFDLWRALKKSNAQYCDFFDVFNALVEARNGNVHGRPLSDPEKRAMVPLVRSYLWSLPDDVNSLIDMPVTSVKGVKRVRVGNSAKFRVTLKPLRGSGTHPDQQPIDCPQNEDWIEDTLVLMSTEEATSPINVPSWLATLDAERGEDTLWLFQGRGEKGLNFRTCRPGGNPDRQVPDLYPDLEKQAPFLLDARLPEADAPLADPAVALEKFTRRVRQYINNDGRLDEHERAFLRDLAEDLDIPPSESVRIVSELEAQLTVIPPTPDTAIIESLAADSAQAEAIAVSPTGVAATPRRRIWLIAAGAGGADWTDWLSAGNMGIDFGTVDTVGDLSTVASRAAVHARIGAPGSQLGNDSLALWQFSHEMQVGDIVWAKAGRSNLLGRGEIVSEYRFCPAERYPHQRQVRWEPLSVKLVDNTLALKTLTDITENRALLREAGQSESRQAGASGSPRAESGSSPTQLASRLQALLGEAGSNALRSAMGIKSATGEVSAQMVNSLLDTLGYQEKYDDGSRRLTTPGRALGMETESVSAKGQVIHTIKWRDAVLVPLAESARAMTRAHEAHGSEPADDEDVDDVDDATVLLDYVDLMALTVGEARACDGVDEYISALTGLTTRTVSKHLNAAAPQKRIRNLFELPGMGDVGELTARRAIDLRMSSAIAGWAELDVTDVDSRLRAVPGQTKVRTALGRDWPSE